MIDYVKIASYLKCDIMSNIHSIKQKQFSFYSDDYIAIDTNAVIINKEVYWTQFNLNSISLGGDYSFFNRLIFFLIQFLFQFRFMNFL